MAAMEIDPPLQTFLQKINPIRPKIQELYLFGSRARGDEKPYSDYDLLLVVEKREPRMLDTLYDAVTDVLTSTGRVISLKIFPRDEYRRLSSIPTPFMKRFLSERISLG